MSDPSKINQAIADLIELPAAERIESVINHAFGGLHHVRKFTEHKETKYSWWSCNVHDLCTVDSDNLTRLVVAAVEYGIRVEIGTAGPRYLKLRMFPRYAREGAFHERAPRLTHWAILFDYAHRLNRAIESRKVQP
jgi:hypothetical protein